MVVVVVEEDAWGPREQRGERRTRRRKCAVVAPRKGGKRVWIRARARPFSRTANSRDGRGWRAPGAEAAAAVEAAAAATVMVLVVEEEDA
jgi:hypothetical protein